MKVIAVNGITKTGKTSVCETIISGLRQRGFSVGSVKEIHFEQFKIDPDQNTNTNRHRLAGSQLVTARGLYETDVLFQKMLPIDEILTFYEHDYVVLEGVSDCNAPRIITAKTETEVFDHLDNRVVAVSGLVANTGIREIAGRPVYHAFNQADELVEFVMEHSFSPLPSFDPDCCSRCGYTCRELAGLIAQGEAQRSDCVLENQSVELLVNGKPIQMVPFVQNILRNAVLGVASELSGYQKNAEINVRIKSQ